MAVSLWSLGVVAAGGVLAWSAVYDPEGGPIGVVRDLLSGRRPTPGVQRTTPIRTFTPGSGATGASAWMESNAGAAKGAAVVAAAKRYIGVPYRWGGASRNGVDCSGLVLLAYRDALGISLPHLADAQMRKARIIPQAQARPGDLVGWPSPANYSHIGILVDAGHTIEAQTSGTRVGIFPLGRRAGGPPTFARLVPN